MICLKKPTFWIIIHIPIRYANGHPDGAPYEHYGRLQSEQAIQYASEIIEFVRLKMA